MASQARSDSRWTPATGALSAPAVAETHSAWVILLGDRAYKVKKPVRLEFLDFSTRGAREAAAHREVELNRRLAPDVYLGVGDVRGPDGRPCDHVVVMRRMPDDRRLSTLVQSGAAVDDCVRAVARVVASFHASAARSPAIDVAGSLRFVRDKIDRDLHELRAFTPHLVDAESLDEVAQLVRDYVDGRELLFDARVANGQICDGHGDLLGDDVFCLPDGPRILDCIEFDDRLRYGDVLADIAFLAMDLERLGAPELATQLLADYREFSNEQHPASLAHYYIAFRALIRAKVACVRAGQGDGASAGRAASLLGLALDHLRAGRVHLVLVGGPPGTGKSTLAAAVADRLGWTVLRSDEVRKDVTGVGRATASPAALDQGIYDRATSDATYDTMLDRARQALGHGMSVLLDASWSRRDARGRATTVARATSSALVELRCDAPEAVAAERIRARRARATDPSDATVAVAEALRRGFETWPSAIRLDTEQPLERSVCAALDAIGRPERSVS